MIEVCSWCIEFSLHFVIDTHCAVLIGYMLRLGDTLVSLINVTSRQITKQSPNVSKIAQAEIVPYKITFQLVVRLSYFDDNLASYAIFK